MTSSSADAAQPLSRIQLARRSRVIVAAIAVINRDGLAAASVDTIAKQAAIGKSTVLYHFKSKEGIYEAVVGNLFADGAAYMAPYILAAKTPKERLHAYITANLRYIAEHADHIAAAHQIANSTIAKDAGDQAVDWLQHMLEDGQKEGVFGTFDARVTSLVIRGTIDNASYYFLSHPTINTDLYIQEVAQLFSNAVAPKGRSTM